VLHIINTYFEIMQNVNERVIKLITILIEKPNPRSFSKDEREKIVNLIRTQNSLFKLTGNLTLNLIQLINSIKQKNYLLISDFLIRSTNIWSEYNQITKNELNYKIKEIGEELYV